MSRKVDRLDVSGSESSGSDSRLVEILQRCARQLETGQSLNRQQIVDDHPEIAAQVTECLDALEFVYSVAPQIGAAESSETLPGDDAVDHLQDRASVGDFKLVREIGRGGMGIVYLAEQMSLGRQVAIKVLPFASMLDPRQLDRFKNEARAAALLHHPNIVPIFSVSSDRGVYYYAMQFIEGQTLAELIAEIRTNDGRRGSEASSALSALSAKTNRSTGTDVSLTGNRHFRALARLAVQAAEALEHAHQLGVTHRDIKPSNLMVDARGHLWITDFGLARVESAGDLTMTGDMLGTLRYMSPEQALGSRLPIDHRTDIYSLGVTLYELLTLRPAINEKDRKEVLRAIEFQEPEPPRRVDPAIPRPLEIIVLKAIAKDRDERYLRAADFAEDLGRFLRDESILARPPSTVQKLESYCRRHRSAVIAAGTGTLAVLLASVVALFIGNRMISYQRDRVASQKNRAEVAEQRSQDRLFKSLLSEAELARRVGAGGRFWGLEKIREAARLIPDLEVSRSDVIRCRNGAIAALTLMDLRVDKAWKALPQFVDHTGVAFDVELQRYACPNEDKTISVRQMVDNLVLYRLSVAQSPDNWMGWRPWLRFSPNGRFLATPGSPELKVPAQIWDLTDEELAQPSVIAEMPATTIDFDTESSVCAVAYDDKTVRIIDVSTGNERERFEFGFQVYHVRFGPLGKKLACYGLGAELIDLETSERIGLWGAFDGRVAPAWHPSGERLAVAIGNAVKVYDVLKGGDQISSYSADSEIAHLAYNHPGDLLSITSWEGTTTIWDSIERRSMLTAEGFGVGFSANDRWLAIGAVGTTIGRWELARSEVYQRLVGSFAERGSLDFSSDNRLVASTGDKGVHIWRVGDGSSLGLLKLRGSHAAAFDPQGQSLFTAGEIGLLQWPTGFDIRSSGETVITIGPPKRIELPDGYMPVYCQLSDDGQNLLVKTVPDAVRVLDTQTWATKLKLDFNTLWFAQLSPDAQWMAWATWHGDCGVTDVVQKVHRSTWPLVRARSTFSPDNRYLVIGSNERFDIYEIGSWKLRAQIDRRTYAASFRAAAAFSPDSQLLALADGNQTVKLFECGDFAEIATLTPPSPGLINWIRFDQSGNKLGVLTADGIVHLWDLPKLRQELSRMGLDWLGRNAPITEPHSFDPLVLEVDYGELPTARNE